MNTINKNEMIMAITNGSVDANDLAEYLLRMRDAMARYFLASGDMDFDKDECHSLYEFATQTAELLQA